MSYIDNEAVSYLRAKNWDALPMDLKEYMF